MAESMASIGVFGTLSLSIHSVLAGLGLFESYTGGVVGPHGSYDATCTRRD